MLERERQINPARERPKEGKERTERSQEYIAASEAAIRELAALRAENAALKEELKKEQTDGLTGLDRRELFERELETLLHAQQSNSNTPMKHISVVYADIDHFKDVNDRFGHDEGDKVLRRVAKVLSSVRKGDVVGRLGDKPEETGDAGKEGEAPNIAGRLGGEEMAIVLIGATEQQAAARAQNLLEQIRGLPFEVNGKQFQITASFGVATSDGTESVSAAELLKRADGAMYFAKENGRNRVITSSKKREEDARQATLALQHQDGFH